MDFIRFNHRHYHHHHSDLEDLSGDFSILFTAIFLISLIREFSSSLGMNFD